MTDFSIELCRWLLKLKFASQNHALNTEILKIKDQNSLAISPKHLPAEIQTCTDELASCDSLDGLLSLEGRAAQAYWRILVGRPLPWPTWALKRIPDHWKAVGPRESGGRNRVRDASDPFNAILNYSYTLLEVETRIACAAHGLDPDLGLLHVDDRLRESFVFDLLEPLRAKVDVWALELISKKGLRPYMFHELRDGIVRLDPDLAKLLAESLMPKVRGTALELASQYVTQLRKVKLPYRLQRFGGNALKATPTLIAATECGYCKQPLRKKGLKFCGRQCFLRHSVEIRQPIKLAQARWTEMRELGLNPGHGGEAAKKRGKAMAQTNNRLALNLTADEWRSRRAAQARMRRGGTVREVEDESNTE
jgi:CRISPR-associated endonuclease Cas1